MRQDSMIPPHHVNFSVGIIPHREECEGDYLKHFLAESLVWFTDSSRIIVRARISIPLSHCTEDFQAEVFVILACAQENLNRACKDINIYICSDSWTTLDMLSVHKVDSDRLKTAELP